MNWYITVLKKYAVFSGRASRQEYWMFFLFNFIIAIGIGILEGILGIVGMLSLIYSLAIIIPCFAVGIRRLHDTDRSGWWLLIAFVPVVGVIALLVFYCLDSTPGTNRFGPNPKGVGA